MSAPAECPFLAFCPDLLKTSPSVRSSRTAKTRKTSYTRLGVHLACQGLGDSDEQGFRTTALSRMQQNRKSRVARSQRYRPQATRRSALSRRRREKFAIASRRQSVAAGGPQSNLSISPLRVMVYRPSMKYGCDSKGHGEDRRVGCFAGAGATGCRDCGRGVTFNVTLDVCWRDRRRRRGQRAPFRSGGADDGGPRGGDSVVLQCHAADSRGGGSVAD